MLKSVLTMIYRDLYAGRLRGGRAGMPATGRICGGGGGWGRLGGGAGRESGRGGGVWGMRTVRGGLPGRLVPGWPPPQLGTGLLECARAVRERSVGLNGSAFRRRPRLVRVVASASL